MTSVPSMTVAEALGSAPKVISDLMGDSILERCFRTAGLPESMAFHVGHYIPEIALSRFFDAAARGAGDDLLGLRLAEHLSVTEYGPWGDYVLEAENLGAALQRAVDIMHLHADADTLTVRTGNLTTQFQYAFAEKSGSGYRQIALAALGPLMSIPRHFCGQGWQPASVGVDLNDKTAARNIEARLRIASTSDSNCISIEIPNPDLSAHNPETPIAWTTIQDVERSCLGGPPPNLASCVEALVMQSLATDAATIEDVAFIMATSTRTLQRRLNDHGTDFRSVTALARMRRATELLTGSSTTVSEIASQLGYSTTSHFSRAFRKSAGIAPNEFRTQFARTLR